MSNKNQRRLTSGNVVGNVGWSPFLGTGYDKIFQAYWDLNDLPTTDKYPPYNIFRDVDATTNQIKIQLQVAVTGFEKSEVDVVYGAGKLKVTAKKNPFTKEESREVVHNGLAQRNFEKEWVLHERIEIVDASVANGVLTINLSELAPEKPKYQHIDIKGE
jgi:molecular chaperone IbpA